MKNLIIAVILLNVLSFCIAQQRVAPGVPPQAYQPPPPQHHQQQQQQQYQQQQHGQYQQAPVQHQQQVNIPQQQQPQQHVPMQQQQQVPVQQQQHQQPQHQQAQHHGQGGHGGHAPHGSHQQQILHAGNLQEEREHIAGHMEVPIDTSKMTNEELQFHYFKMHDSDNNNKLDGCELIKSLIHWHAENEDKANADPNEKHPAHGQTDEQLQSLVDPILTLMDKDSDGYITYTEYKMADPAQVKP